MKNIILALLSLITIYSFAQDEMEPNPEDYNSVMTFTEFWQNVFKDDTIPVDLRNIYVTTADREEFESVTNEILKRPKTVRKRIFIQNVFFRGYTHEYFQNYSSNQIEIDSTNFLQNTRLSLTGNQGLIITNCEFNNSVDFRVDSKSWLGIQIYNCKFRKGYWFGISGTPLSDEITTRLVLKNSVLKRGRENVFSRFDEIRIEDCSFPNSKVQSEKELLDLMILNSEDNLSKLEIINSTFEYPIRPVPISIDKGFHILNSELDLIAINMLKFPEDIYEISCKWSILKTSLAFVKYNQSESGKTYEFYNLYSDSSVIVDEIHDLLKSKAYQFLNIYRAQGDLKSYNACYTDIKIFENKRLKHDYKNSPTFEGWFHWRLNELIASYSDYGTNPAKAVIKSIWVILLFAIFYMFFPSEWDISSKSAIIANFKRIGNKNDKTTSPLLKAFAYILVSFLNAFTLSINSFITLGFGNIPTKGIARYITILQGFIGWFLLTIFSVSLISQILN